jgi:hypothetical protein
VRATCGRGPRTVRAGSLGAAASAAGITLDRYVVAAVNGDPMTRNAELPLVHGDTVAFRSSAAGGERTYARGCAGWASTRHRQRLLN